ncbi:hypothetical protein D3C81_1056370 [compost metagenome]
MDQVVGGQTHGDVLDDFRQRRRFGEVLIHQAHISLEVFKQHALRHVVFHHQRDVLPVGDQRHAVAAHQVIHRQHHHAEHLLQPGFSAQAGASNIGGDQRLAMIVGFHQRRHQNGLFALLQIARRVLTPDHAKHFLIAVGGFGQGCVGWVGHITRRRFTQDFGAAGAQRAVFGKDLLQPAGSGRSGADVLTRNTAITRGVVNGQRQFDVERGAAADIGQGTQRLLCQIVVTKFPQLHQFTFGQLRQEVQRDLLLPLPRMQGHRDPVMGQFQLAPALVEALAFGAVHGAIEQLGQRICFISTPDEAATLGRHPVQAKLALVFRGILLQRGQAPTTTTFIKDKLGMSGQQALQRIGVQCDQILRTHTVTGRQQLHIAAQRGVQVFQMFCDLRIVHFQHLRQLAQRLVGG